MNKSQQPSDKPANTAKPSKTTKPGKTAKPSKTANPGKASKPGKATKASKAPRAQERRAELIVVGRRLFARTSYDALSIDDIAYHAGVAKGLIYYYFTNKRGYYLAVVEDSVTELIRNAKGDPELPVRERLLHTLDGYLRFARGHESAYRTIVSGGVGFDTEVLAIRDRVRGRLLATIAEGAYGQTELAPVARTALTGWLSYVEGATLDWLQHRDLSRDLLRTLLAATLLETLRTIERFAPQHPVPPAAG